MKNKKITAAVLAGALSLSLTTAVLADADPCDIYPANSERFVGQGTF